MSRNDRIDELPIRPIEPLRKDIVVPQLPSWHGKPVQVKIEVSWIDKAYLDGYQAYQAISIGTRIGWALIKAAIMLDELFKSREGKKMDEKWYESRRVWATVFSVITVILGVFKVAVPEQVAAIGPDIAVTIATAISGVISGVLAIISWFKPKK